MCSIGKSGPSRIKSRRAHIATGFTFVAAILADGCGGSSESPPRDVVYEAAGDGVTSVFRVDPETREATQLTSGSGFDGNPAWSPDGTSIVFVSNRDAGQADIYVMDADGANPVRLTNTVAREVAPKFSPDGKKIAFALQDETEWTLRMMNSDGSGDEQLAGPYKFVEFPSWRPGGKEIFYSAIPLSGGAADILGIDLETRAVSPKISTQASDVCPHFSHDGKWLTYATDSGDAGGVDVFRHDLSSPQAGRDGDLRLTYAPGVDDYANYSPDDRSLVFVTRRDGQSELYVMDADGANPRPLTSTVGLQENVPDW